MDDRDCGWNDCWPHEGQPWQAAEEAVIPVIVSGIFSAAGQGTFVLPARAGVTRSQCGLRGTSAPRVRRCEPIFIIGSPRSGTSIFTWCLGQHPNILVQEESNWLSGFAYSLQSCFEIGSARGARSQLSAMGIGREELFALMGATVDQLIGSHQGQLEALSREAARRNPDNVNPAFCLTRSDEDPKGRWVDGTPEYSFCVTGLRYLFPRAKFIHVLRDVDSVVKSLLKFGPGVVADETEAYQYWLRTVRACVEAEKAYGSEVVMRLRYRDLVETPENALQRCLAFLNEPFAPCILEPLGTRINSSRVPEGFDPTDPKTDPALRQMARQFSEDLLAEEDAPRDPDPAVASALEEDFVARARHLARAGTDLQWALRRLVAAERELAAARGTTSIEAAGDLVQRLTPYHARIVVALRRGEEVPYLHGREPLPVWIPQDRGESRTTDTTQPEQLLAELRKMRKQGARHLLVAESLLASEPEGAEMRELIDPFYRVIGQCAGWVLYAC